MDDIQARVSIGEMLLIGDVGTDITFKGIEAALRPFANAGRLTLRINSPGGSLVEANAIYNSLRRHPARKTVVVEGIAASAASLIAMVGDEIVMPANAFLMLHHPRVMTGGTSADLHAQADVLARMEEACIAIYAQRSRQTPERVRELMDAETWLTSQEAVALGFADRIEAPLEAQAHFDLSRFTNVPNGLAKAGASAAVNHPAAAPSKDETHMTKEAQEPIGSIADLRHLAVNTLGLSDSDVLNIATSRPQAEWREAMMDAKAARSPARPAGIISPTLDNPQTRMQAMTGALSARMGGKLPTSSDPAQAFMAMPVVEMARELLETRGVAARRMSRDQVIDATMSFGAHTTSDFPNLLTNAGNRVLADAYTANTSPIRSALCRVRDVPDFRKVTNVRLGEFPVLDKIPEHASVPFGSVGEVAEGYKVDTHAKQFGLTREALVNDDLGAFSNMATWAGSAVAETEARVLVALLTANSGAGPTMSDGKALFHADHGNVAGAAGVLELNTLSTGRTAMRRAKGLDGTTSIAVAAKYLLVAPENETKAEQILLSAFLTSPTDSSVVQFNPMVSKMELLVEPRLTALPWYLFADPALGAVFEVAYLAGSNRAPEFKTFEAADFLGYRFRVVHDFGAGVVGWRGAYRNAGA
ncbi:Clp protease ClpP [Roseomonas gilardii subsp. gilardii]|uniref:head maturation protease, ClpP-related n=1 Tax=Roseomonas gilardii TaxID=257708 RepID=UPI001FFA2D0C|nr:head maturation protease, ClpP-related [Roseomonas gilardii]UPG72903.1 Clp protease ClpP [Roseomonas gilardii subsp. gilardii]